MSENKGENQNGVHSQATRNVNNLEPHACFAYTKCTILHWTNQNGPVRTGMGEKVKAKEQNPFIKYDTPIIKVVNPTTDPVGALPFQNLKIQPNKKDKKVLDVSTTPISALEQGAKGTVPKNSISKLDTEPEEQDKTATCELRMQIEEAKYKLYIGQLSTEENDMERETDESEYPFLG